MDEKEALFNMVMARFDKLDQDLMSMNATLKEHVEIDARYWQRIDSNRAQLSLLKWLVGGMGSSGLLAWLYNKLH